MAAIPLFHLAFPVDDLNKAREFYGGLLGCSEGRSSREWVDFNFYRHQIVAHLAPDEAGHRATSAVDGDNVPARHFGVILSMAGMAEACGQAEPRRRQFHDRAPRPLQGATR